MSEATVTRNHTLETMLTNLLADSRLGRPLYVYEQLGSTMDEAHRLAQEGAPEGALVLALRQEQGRGRLGRSWISPEGGLYLSIVLRPKRSAAAAQLSLVAGLAAAEAIRDAASVYLSITWPNDLLLGGKKVAGILAETCTSAASYRLQATGHREPEAGSLQPGVQLAACSLQPAVVLGVGINLRTPADALPDTATSLAAFGASHGSRDDVLVGLCRQLSQWYDVWTEQGFAPIREALRPWMGLGQLVKISTSQHTTHSTQHTARLQDTEVQGQALDIDESGRLVVRLDAGMLRAFDVGEVTLLR